MPGLSSIIGSFFAAQNSQDPSKMPIAHSDLKDLRTAIIADTKRFLLGLDVGASEELLTSILLEIRERELQLLKEEGTMLDPEMWKILHSRLTKRKNDIIDITD
jgi:hypothetical protein